MVEGQSMNIVEAALLLTVVAAIALVIAGHLSGIADFTNSVYGNWILVSPVNP